ncbi:MAG: APC family permease [Clostridioides sp.]|jgi:APA family basic amino acid/polyamine antiporter|nr:APC family permease [Clostridioides sp.]
MSNHIASEISNNNSLETKKLGIKELTSLSAGQVIGAGVVTLVGQAIGLTGRSVWLAYMTAILMGFCIIFPYLMLSSMIRVKGGNYSFVAAVLGDTWGGVYGMVFTLNMLASGMFGISMGTYINSIIPSVPITPTAIVTVTLFFVLNLSDVGIIAKAQNYMTITLLTGLALFIIIGIFKLQPGTFNFSSPDYFTGGKSGFLAAVMMLVYSCTGHSFVVSFSKDAKNPRRDVPFAIIFATIIILVVYCSIALVDSNILPIKEVTARPLTDVAKTIMSKPLAYAFVIGGPIAALATTLNSSYGVFSRPVAQMCADGWFSKSLTKKNKNGVPYKVMFVMYVISILPILLGLNIKEIVSNVVLVARIADIVGVVAVMFVPKKLPEAWENRYFKIPKSLFYLLMTISLIVSLTCVILSLRTITQTQVIATVILLIVFFVYSTIRQRSGKVKMEKSYELN